LDLLARPQPFPADQRFPRHRIAAAKKQQFHFTAGRLAGVEARRNDTGAVEDEQVAGVQSPPLKGKQAEVPKEAVF